MRVRVRVAHDLNQLVVLGRVDRGERQHLELAAEVARGHAQAHPSRRFGADDVSG